MLNAVLDYVYRHDQACGWGTCGSSHGHVQAPSRPGGRLQQTMPYQVISSYYDYIANKLKNFS